MNLYICFYLGNKKMRSGVGSCEATFCSLTHNSSIKGTIANPVSYVVSQMC